jgi:hypothetical protein
MSFNLRLILDTIDACSKETKIDIAGYPFATKLQGIGTPDQVLHVYQIRAQEIENYLGKDQILVDQLLPIVHTLYSLSGVLGETVSLVRLTVNYNYIIHSLRLALQGTISGYKGNPSCCRRSPHSELFNSYNLITVTASHHLGYQWAQFRM